MAIGKMFLRGNRGWYCKVDGKFFHLCYEEDCARAAYRQLQLNEGEMKNANVSDLVEIYLRHCKTRSKPLKASTLEKKRAILDTFVAMYGKLDARQIKERHVEDWLKKHYPNVNDTTKRDRIAEPQAVWTFALKRGLINRNPLCLIYKPTPSMRIHHVPHAKWPEMLDLCHPRLRDLVEFMLHTGARAQEAVLVACDEWDHGRFTLPPSRSKGGKTIRTIVVPTAFRAKVDALVKAAGSGHVFLNSDGLPWNKNSLNCAFRRLKKVMKDPDLCATSCRHSFAAWKLLSGVDVATVAKLMGHSSTKMVYSRYGKWLESGLMDAGANAGVG